MFYFFEFVMLLFYVVFCIVNVSAYKTKFIIDTVFQQPNKLYKKHQKLYIIKNQINILINLSFSFIVIYILLLY